MNRLDWLADGMGLTSLPSITTTVDEDVESAPMLYTDFVAELGFALLPGQYVFARVAFDGVDPRDLDTDEERALARLIFGPLDVVEPSARDVIVGVMGGRAGKTRMFAMRMLHLALTVALPNLAPGEVASGPIIAPDKDLATQPLDYIKGACRHPDILQFVCNKRHLSPESEGVDLQREDGKVVELVIRAASGRGRTGRGRSLIGAYLDESAFFLDASYKVNDSEIFKAVRPRVVPGGQTLIGTTPWAQAGLVYDLFAANHPEPSVAGLVAPAKNEGTVLAAHAPSLVLRDDPSLRTMVDAETKRDPENAAREYGAKFMSAGAETFFDGACLAASVDYDMPLETLPTPGQQSTSGIDLGFTTNSSALVVARLGDTRAEVGFIREWKPEVGKPLKPSVVFRDAAADMKRHGVTAVMGDAHYREAVDEALVESGLGFIDAPTVPSEAFVRVRTLMREGKVRMPNHERLLRQLRETVGKKTAGGAVQIILPRWRTGEHGDLASAFVLALFQAAGEVVMGDAPRHGTAEYWAAEEAKRLAERRKQVGQAKNQPFWRRGR